MIQSANTCKEFYYLFYVFPKKRKKNGNILLINTKAFKGKFVTDFMATSEVCNQFFRAYIFKEDR